MELWRGAGVGFPGRGGRQAAIISEGSVDERNAGTVGQGALVRCPRELVRSSGTCEGSNTGEVDVSE
eukprot:7803432-Prorocentrum_lima.AAC.1